MKGKPKFLQHLERNGVFGSVVSIDHLEELGQEIRSLHVRGLIHDDIYNCGGDDRPYHTPRLPRSLPDAKSIIIVTTPHPMVRTTFNWRGRKTQLLVPPTYFDGLKVANRARNLLKEAFRPEEHRFVRALLPQKLLAVRSGLALYGRNNITYIPRFGSFHRPTSFYSDYESPVDYWQDKRALPLCEKCKACLKACPTKAIHADRFLISADKCLTFLNEKPSKVEFPSWVDPSAHNALVGCMRCQLACPYDKDLVGWYEDREEFSDEETAYLLGGKFSGKKAAGMERKLKRVGLDLSSFPRNLRALLGRERCETTPYR